MLVFWIVIFVLALGLVLKGADWLLESAERIGVAAGLSPFVVGVIIVGLGTSFPELVTAIVAVIQDVPEIVPANAIGSNIANILLIIGTAAVVGRRLTVTTDLIDLDLPLLAISTALLLGTVYDGLVTTIEALILLVTYGVYLVYTFIRQPAEDLGKEEELLPSRVERRGILFSIFRFGPVGLKDIWLFLIGAAALGVGSHFLIESVIALSAGLNIAPGVIAVTAVAFGTSLPELLVSVKAALESKSEVAIGNVFGSNSFNALVVIGLPGLFTNLPLDEQTLTLGVPAVAIATLLFVISGISRRMYLWEGAFYLALYVLFIGKLFALF